MTGKAVGAAFDTDVPTGKNHKTTGDPIYSSTAKLVLVSLADSANTEDWTCFLKIDTIARKCSITVKAARAQVKLLRQLGLVHRQRNAYEGRSDRRIPVGKRPNMWQVLPTHPLRPGELMPDDGLDLGGTETTPQGGGTETTGHGGTETTGQTPDLGAPKRPPEPPPLEPPMGNGPPTLDEDQAATDMAEAFAAAIGRDVSHRPPNWAQAWVEPCRQLIRRESRGGAMTAEVVRSIEARWAFATTDVYWADEISAGRIKNPHQLNQRPGFEKQFAGWEPSGPGADLGDIDLRDSSAIDAQAWWLQVELAQADVDRVGCTIAEILQTREAPHEVMAAATQCGGDRSRFIDLLRQPRIVNLRVVAG